MKAKVTMTNVISYIIGNLRYKLYYSKFFSFLIRKHIKEQIDFRIKHMDKECYNSGSCKVCGCTTTALQMAAKSCDGLCYPEMMEENCWKIFKQGRWSCTDKNGSWWLDTADNSLYLNGKIKRYD